jgi:predicted TIM-barrel fold metal-dependent hydrolase
MNASQYPEIIDIHSHVYPEKIASKAVISISSFYGIPASGKGTADDLRRLTRKAGISLVTVSSTATKPQQVPSINDFLAGLSSQFKEMISFGTIHPEFPFPAKEIDRAVALGLKGIKLHPDCQQYNIDDPLLFPTYEAMEGRLPLLFHIGDDRMDYSSPARLVKILDRFPKLTVIAAHLGGYKIWEEGARVLLGRNVYIDTSSALMFLAKEKAVRIIRTHGVDKVLFGTDYPLWIPKTELERFLSLGLTKEENEKILFKNAKKLLNLAPFNQKPVPLNTVSES